VVAPSVRSLGASTVGPRSVAGGVDEAKRGRLVADMLKRSQQRKLKPSSKPIGLGARGKGFSKFMKESSRSLALRAPVKVRTLSAPRGRGELATYGRAGASQSVSKNITSRVDTSPTASSVTGSVALPSPGRRGQFMDFEFTSATASYREGEAKDLHLG